MKKILSLPSHLTNNELKITVLKNRISVLNYEKIKEISNNRVILQSELEIIIEGSNLVVNKLLDDEILIVGIVKKIEMR